MSRACTKATSASLRKRGCGIDGLAVSLPAALSSRYSEAQRTALRLRFWSSQAICVIVGRSRTKLIAWPVKSSTSVSRLTSSLAMRTSCSWFSIKCNRICCCAISVSRFSDSVSRSISSLRRYQKAEMIAARNNSTDTSGASVTNRSCRDADCRATSCPAVDASAPRPSSDGWGWAKSQTYGPRLSEAWAKLGRHRQSAHRIAVCETTHLSFEMATLCGTLAPNCKNGLSTIDRRQSHVRNARFEERQPPLTPMPRKPANGWTRSARRSRPKAASVPTSCWRTDRRSTPVGHRHAVLGDHRLRQHHRARGRAAQPRQPRTRRPPARLHALERDGDGGQGQPPAPGRRR